LYQAAANIDSIEKLAMQDTGIHRLHPMAKLTTTFFYVVIVISFPISNVSGLVPFLIYPIIIMALSQTPYKPLFKRLLIALPFALMGGISNLIFMRGTAFTIGTFAVSNGLVSFVSILLKTLLCVLAILILIATTTFVDISHQLAHLRLPKIICLQFVMTYRYISVLLGEVVSMYTAYSLRAPDIKGIKLKDMGSFLGQLILRSFDRADQVYQAMKCRGFEGVYFGRTRHGYYFSDYAYMFLIIAAMLFLRFFNFSTFLGNIVR